MSDHIRKVANLVNNHESMMIEQHALYIFVVPLPPHHPKKHPLLLWKGMLQYHLPSHHQHRCPSAGAEALGYLGVDQRIIWSVLLSLDRLIRFSLRNLLGSWSCIYSPEFPPEQLPMDFSGEGRGS